MMPIERMDRRHFLWCGCLVARLQGPVSDGFYLWLGRCKWTGPLATMTDVENAIGASS